MSKINHDRGLLRLIGSHKNISNENRKLAKELEKLREFPRQETSCVAPSHGSDTGSLMKIVTGITHYLK